MIHTLHIPDSSRGGERADIVWDDEAGSVSGDHSIVVQPPPNLPSLLAGPFPVRCPTITGSRYLDDPAHDPADFLALVGSLVGFGPDDLPPDGLPAALRSVRPTPIRRSRALPPGAVA